MFEHVRRNLNAEPTWAELDAGQYHPRMFRGDIEDPELPICPQRRLRHLERVDFQLSVEQEEMAVDELIAICRVVMPTVENHHVSGSRIRNLLITVCTEIEAQWRGILQANNYTGPRGQRLTTEDYAVLHEVLRLDNYVIDAVRFEHYPPLQPFLGWLASAPSQSLPWYDAYNRTKHDRVANFGLATLQHAINAVAALHVMLMAQYGPIYLERRRTAFFLPATVPAWRGTERSFAKPHSVNDWIAIPYFEQDAQYCSC